MDCRRVKEVIFLYTDNEMEEEVRVVFTRHLSVCPECAARIRRAYRLLGLVRRRCARASAPAGLRERILMRLQIGPADGR